jgi:hypothetical protein
MLIQSHSKPSDTISLPSNHVASDCTAAGEEGDSEAVEVCRRCQRGREETWSGLSGRSGAETIRIQRPRLEVVARRETGAWRCPAA